MKKLIAGVSIATMCGVAIVGAADRKNDDKDKPVTISGCVRSGTEPDTFLLMNVAEVKRGNDQAVPLDTRGRSVLYWLSSTKGLRIRDGQRVEVVGTVDMTKSDDGETKSKDDSSKTLDSTKEVKSDGKKVTVETDSLPLVAPTSTGDKEKSESKEKNRVVYTLHVKSVRTIRGSCQQQQ